MMQINELNELEKKLLDTEEKFKKLSEEKVKDIKELKDILSGLETTKQQLLEEIKDKLVRLMPPTKDNENKAESINAIKEYYRLLGNCNGINKFRDLNSLLYVLENPEDLTDFNKTLKDIVYLLKEYQLDISADTFDVSPYVKKYMTKFLEVIVDKDYLNIMKDKFDEIYWNSHELLKDIVLNIRLIIFSNVDKIITYLTKKKNQFVKENNINEDTVKETFDSLRIKETTENKVNPEKILYNLKEGKINIEHLDENSGAYKNAVKTFVTEEYYEECNRDDFYENISYLIFNLNEFKFYSKYKYLIDVISDILTKKDENKSVYSTKKTNIKKLISEKTKINNSIEKLNKEKEKLSTSKTFSFLEASKKSKLVKITKKISELTVTAENNIDALKTEFQDFDLALFREKVAAKVDKTYTIFDDFKLFENNVFILKKYIKENEPDISTSELNSLFDEFHVFITYPMIQITNKFDFNKVEDVEAIIEEKYKLLDINFELDEETMDNLLESARIIIQAYNAKIAELDPDIVRMIDKYIIKK